jgi:hypothetical protein
MLATAASISGEAVGIGADGVAFVRKEDGSMLPLHLVIIACASPVADTQCDAEVLVTNIVKTVTDYFSGAIGVAGDHHKMGHTPLLLALYSHAGWEVNEALTSCRLGGLQALDSDNNKALHLLVSNHYKDAAAALAVLRAAPAAATATALNENGMLLIEVSCLFLPNHGSSPRALYANASS